MKSERALGVLEEKHFHKEGAAFRDHSVRRFVHCLHNWGSFLTKLQQLFRGEGGANLSIHEQ